MAEDRQAPAPSQQAQLSDPRLGPGQTADTPTHRRTPHARTIAASPAWVTKHGQEHEFDVYLEQIKTGPPETPEEIEADERHLRARVPAHLKKLLEMLQVESEVPEKLDEKNSVSYGGYPKPLRVWDRANRVDMSVWPCDTRGVTQKMMTWPRLLGRSIEITTGYGIDDLNSS